MKKQRTHGPDYIGFKDVAGVTALSTVKSIGMIFISTILMTYFTDYAGLGAWGAILATTVLVFARIIDAVDDPIQGMIMDNAKTTKIGRYKPFFLITIITVTVGIVMLYGIPSGMLQNHVLVVIWVLVAYFLTDIGISFYNPNLLYRNMTTDSGQRAKLLTAPRVWTMIISMGTASITTIVVALGDKMGSYHDAYTVVIGGFMAAAFVISMIGWFVVKEKNMTPDKEEKEDKVKLSDFILLFKENRPMVIFFLKSLFSGFVWTLLFATASYYVKWGYCADITTGVVDMPKVGIYNLIIGILTMIPVLLGAFIARPLEKKLGSAVALTKVNLIMMSISGALLFILQITGILIKSPICMFVLLFVSALAVGIDYIPQGQIDMEIMDYQIWKNGKDRSAMTYVARKFLEKGQSAIATAAVGALLIAVGYSVNSDAGFYTGDLTKLPGVLNWFIIIMGLIPAILACAGYFIMRKYPIDAQQRAEMKEYFSKKKEEA